MALQRCSYRAEIDPPRSIVFASAYCPELAHKNGLCVFHDPDPNKNATVLADRLRERLEDRNENPIRLDGAIFPDGVSFEGMAFDRSVSFFKAEFHGQVTSFSKATFAGEEVFFEKARFLANDTTFEGSKFSGRHVTFQDAIFRGETTTFGYANFSSEEVRFFEAEFHSHATAFVATAFRCDRVVFSYAKFRGQYTTFHSARFEAKLVYFAGVEFLGAEVWLTCLFESPRVTFWDAKFLARRTRLAQPGQAGGLLFGGREPSGVFLKGFVEIETGPYSEAGSVVFDWVDLRRTRLLGADVSNMKFFDVTWARPETPGQRWLPRRNWRLGVYDEVVWRRKRRTARPAAEFDAKYLSGLGRCYRILKDYYKSTGEHHLVGNFHYGLMEIRWYQRELDQLRKGSSWVRRKWKKWFSWEAAYRLCSGYGEDYAWAGGVLLALIFLFAIVYAILGLPLGVQAESRWARGLHALLYSFQVATLGRVTFYEPAKDLVVHFLQLVESIVVPLQFGFFAFALRNVFRR